MAGPRVVVLERFGFGFGPIWFWSVYTLKKILTRIFLNNYSKLILLLCDIIHVLIYAL